MLLSQVLEGSVAVHPFSSPIRLSVLLVASHCSQRCGNVNAAKGHRTPWIPPEGFTPSGGCLRSCVARPSLTQTSRRCETFGRTTLCATPKFSPGRLWAPTTAAVDRAERFRYAEPRWRRSRAA